MLGALQYPGIWWPDRWIPDWDETATFSDIILLDDKMTKLEKSVPPCCSLHHVLEVMLKWVQFIFIATPTIPCCLGAQWHERRSISVSTNLIWPPNACEISGLYPNLALQHNLYTIPHWIREPQALLPSMSSRNIALHQGGRSKPETTINSLKISHSYLPS